MITVTSQNNDINIEFLRPYVYNSNQTHGLSGQVRYNFTLNHFEVFDGTQWQPYTVSIDLSLNNEINELLHWAKQQKEEQNKIKQMCEQYPAVADLKEKLDMMIRLVQQHQ